MTVQQRSLRGIVEGAGRMLHRDALLAIVAVAAAAVPLVLLVGWLVGSWATPSPAPLLLEAVVAVIALVFLVRARRRVRHTLDERAVTRAAENTLRLPSGSLHGALELGRSLPAGASPALAERSERELVARMGVTSPSALTGDLGRTWRRQRATALTGFGALAALVMILGFAAPDRSRSAWTPLLHPVRSMTPPELAPLEVLPGNTTVARGGEVDVRIAAPARTAVTLHWRVQGDIERRAVLGVIGDSAQHALDQLDGPTVYWVIAPDGARSERFTITPVDPLLLSELAADIIYPSYLNRPAERYDGEVPALELPEGTVLSVRGRATRRLAQGTLRPDSGDAVVMQTDGASFGTRWTPQATGLYAWQLRDTDGNELAVQPPPIAITVVRDAPPGVAITFPGVDTVFGPELQLAVAADAQDDHGIAAATLVSWRVGRNGTRDPIVETPLLTAAGDDHAQLRTILDASARGLTGGDSLKYFVRVRDNSPRGQVAESRTYSIRLPGMSELRDAAGDQADELMRRSSELRQQAAKLQEETRNTQRSTSASNARRANGSKDAGSPSPGERMQFAETEAAQRVLDQQQAMLDEISEMRQKVDALQKSLENAGMQDPELKKRMEELRALYEQAMAPELKAKMDQLREALAKMDSKQVEQALKDLAQQQEQMKKQLERSQELLQKAAAEQTLNKLTQEAKELARQQDALASQASDPAKDPQNAGKQQEDVARRNDELVKEIDRMREELAKQGEAKASADMQKANESAKAAAQSMDRAQQSQSPQAAGEQGKKAAQQLSDAARQLETAREEMVQGWKDEAKGDMQQATRDALSLAQRQQALKEQMEKAGQQGSQPQRIGQPPSPPQLGDPSSDRSSGQPQTPKPQPGQQQQGQGQQQSQGQQGQQPGDQGRAGGQGGQSQAGQKQGQQGQQSGSGQAGAPTPGGQNGSGDLQSMRAEQAALQQGLQQLGKNLQESGQSGAGSQEVGASLGKANQSMQQTMSQLQRATPDGQMPSQQASQAVDALNQLALSLLKQSQQGEQTQGGEGGQQGMQQLGEMAKQQASLNGESSSLMPLDLSAGAMSEQVRKLGQGQQQIAKQLDNLSKTPGGDEDLLGSVDALAREAAAIAAEMQGGRLAPQTLARQERLFHRLLDAGRSLEKDEISDERVAERSNAAASQPGVLDPALFRDGTRFRTPTPDELRALPPAYRKLILDYFERLNRPAAPAAPDNSRR